MKCSAFRENHGPFLDDLLADHEIVAMQCHLVECSECATFDTEIRRALLLFRNIPAITPSVDFGKRLSARLGEERRAARALAARPGVATRGPGLRVFAAATASVAVVGYLAAATFARHDAAVRELALPPVVATRLAAPTPMTADGSLTSVSNPAMMASVSAGLPIWPTALLVDQAPLSFATSEFQLTSYGQ